ncbi:MAG: D-glycero-beta-D-manno-heptose 1,7-bisphosphate 7-phosphatase [Gammaproteobacteria bacterium]|nr:D-glycero-beta-D-manno-heptose 1,7-bisphosphate 7-phosphatase [Gammaproteobacteria bacterium]MCP5424435.1 D-glycero-beta-D-manno-heptose 1,7-bisphosphate 7-phosphatase [Gammaproteobacteria bacterium]MCP5458429.1 D-glycero-beta-D-manno-heptose 1,7-bisphosphate 7-phosphatase [Gammaproteobacteria bacterium]
MKLIILDRDGVINEDSPAYIKTPDEWNPIAGSLEALARLSNAGYRVVVTSNQSGIDRGLFDFHTLNRIHEKMHRLAHEAGGNIEAVFFCSDRDDANPQRKPNPGMLEDVARRLHIDLQGVPMIGDSLKDIQAAQAVGARAILVRTGNGERTLTKLDRKLRVEIFADLAEAVDTLLAEDYATRG